MPNTTRTAVTLVWAIVALVLGTLTCVVLLAVLAPPDRLDGLVIQVIGVIAPTLAILATVQQVKNVGERVDKVAEDTHALSNGLLDAKVRSGVAEVLPDHLVDPVYNDGPREADEAAREAHDEGPWSP